MTDFTSEQDEALDIAHRLIDMGVPIFTAYANHGTTGGEFIRPNAWQTFRPNHRQVEIWKPGHALCMVTGVVFDVLDVDPRNGGLDGFRALLEAIEEGPETYGKALTPSEGEHLLIGRTHLAKTSKIGPGVKGVDLQAGEDSGEGRGYIYIAPTVRLSKYGPREGQEVAYRWESEPVAPSRAWAEDGGLKRLVAFARDSRPVKREIATKPGTKPLGIPGTKPLGIPAAAELDDDPFDLAADWTSVEAQRMIQAQLSAVEGAKKGEINNVLGGAARVLGRFVAGGFLTEDEAAGDLLEALERGGVHSDTWNAANRLDWTARGVIGQAFANAESDPWTVEPDVAVEQTKPGEAAPAPRDPTVAAPRIEIKSAADSAYWLQNVLGSGALSGFFSRDGRIAHTPLVDESGYVAARDGQGDNGPAQIRPVSAGELAAKIQYAYSCYKTVKGKDGKPDTEVPALFPLQAAQRSTDAPESMSMLRPLAGITSTPMVRADGTILERPGYDPASRFLFLPGPGVNVRPVPDAPADEDVAAAVALLDDMLAGFPWETKDDRANYLGFLITPLLRLMCPPTYKLFGIGAHQPGSGKTLLADIATTLHGGVLRSEVPEDEPEWRKQTTSILSTTSAPIVHIDNLTGVLKSSVLAGLLTAGQDIQDRELGSTRMLTMTNDRVWCVTGNNLSIGGDLVRRTIIINIDPNMANPETREFRIMDLKDWVRRRRNPLLWALLVMIRRWVSAGMPMAARAQSDSFAYWEKSVGGILAVCGITGDFDNRSGERAATGGGDDDLITLLIHLHDRFGEGSFTVAECLDGTTSTDVGDFVAGSRDWLPDRVLGMLARSEASGRKSLGRYLLYSVGRWVSDGESTLVVRRTGTVKRPQWKIEKLGK